MLKTQNDIDYDGVSGPLTLDDAGDMAPAYYGICTRYNGENKYAFARGVIVAEALAGRETMRYLRGELEVNRVTVILATGPTAVLALSPPARRRNPSPPSRAVDRDPIALKVGTLLPATGALAAFGPLRSQPAQLAVEDIADADAGITVELGVLGLGDSARPTPRSPPWTSCSRPTCPVHHRSDLGQRGTHRS